MYIYRKPINVAVHLEEGGKGGRGQGGGEVGRKRTNSSTAALVDISTNGATTRLPRGARGAAGATRASTQSSRGGGRTKALGALGAKGSLRTLAPVVARKGQGSVADGVHVVVVTTSTSTTSSDSSNSRSSSHGSRDGGRTRAQATNDASKAKGIAIAIVMATTIATAANVNSVLVMIIHRHALLGTLLLPPGRVPVEQAQALLRLAIGGHLVLKLAALLGEGTGAVVDPLVTVNLLAFATTGHSSSNEHVAASAGCAKTVVLSVADQDEGVLAVGSMGDDIVDARLYTTVSVHSFFAPPWRRVGTKGERETARRRKKKGEGGAGGGLLPHVFVAGAPKGPIGTREVS